MILDVNSICDKMELELITFIHNIILLIKLAIPIILVIFGMLDFAKGVMASKEDEIKKGQHTFIQRLIAAVVVFFMISIAQLVISIVDKDSDGDVWKCANAIMNGEIKERIKAPDEDLPNGTYKDGDAHVRCCESLGGKWHGGICEDSEGYIIASDDVDRCVLSGG